MTGEANAAIEGALAGGATRILVNDSHWLMRNLLPEELHPAAELLSGSPKRWSMMEGIELGFDAALCIGYHARVSGVLTRLDLAESLIDGDELIVACRIRVRAQAVQGEQDLGCLILP